MYKKALLTIFLLFCTFFVYAAPEGKRPCIVTYLYVGNRESDADQAFEKYVKEIKNNGWREGETKGVSFEAYVNFTDWLYLIHCDSIITQGVQNTNEQFGVTLMNFNNKLLLLTWSNSQTRYLFYKTFLP